MSLESIPLMFWFLRYQDLHWNELFFTYSFHLFFSSGNSDKLKSDSCDLISGERWRLFQTFITGKADPSNLEWWGNRFFGWVGKIQTLFDFQLMTFSLNPYAVIPHPVDFVRPGLIGVIVESLSPPTILSLIPPMLTACGCWGLQMKMPGLNFSVMMSSWSPVEPKTDLHPAGEIISSSHLCGISRKAGSTVACQLP